LPPNPVAISLRKRALAAQLLDQALQVVGPDHDPVPTARLRPPAVRHRLGRAAGAARRAEQEPKVAAGEDREAGPGLRFDPEPELPDVEPDRRLDVLDDVPGHSRPRLNSPCNTLAFRNDTEARVYSLLAQVGLGLSPLEAGLFALGWPLGIGIASGASIKRAPRVGRGLLGLGTLLMAAGMGALIAALRLDGVDVSPRHLAPGLALRGPGMGMVAPTLTDFVLAGVPERDAGAAPGVLNTIFQVGSAAGLALAGISRIVSSRVAGWYIAPILGRK